MKKEIKWDKESIPDQANLFCYIHFNDINRKTNQPYEKAFQNTPHIDGTDLSADWDKYSTPSETRQRLSLQRNKKGVFKNPDNYFISQLNVQRIRNEVSGQIIEHDPIHNHSELPDNRSHSKIIGEKNVETRLKFVDLCKWAIAPAV